ncbi:MAG: hypothetical protein VW146_00255 [Gammaproteobacteria bacterium]
MNNNQTFTAYVDEWDNSLLQQIIKIWRGQPNTLIVLSEKEISYSTKQKFSQKEYSSIDIDQIINIEHITKHLKGSDGVIVLTNKMHADQVVTQAILQEIPVIGVGTHLMREFFPIEMHLDEKNLLNLISFFVRNASKIDISTIKKHFVEHYSLDFKISK